MPKSALALLLILSVIASLLIGINIGKKIGISQSLEQGPPLRTASSPSPSQPPPTPTPEMPAGLSLYRNVKCGYEFNYYGSLKEITNETYSSALITDTEPESEQLVSTCQDEIPKPPLPPERMEDIEVDGIPTILYHDASQKDQTPRDEIIIKHPEKNLEIIVAGLGRNFREATSSFRFIRE